MPIEVNFEGLDKMLAQMKKIIDTYDEVQIQSIKEAYERLEEDQKKLLAYTSMLYNCPTLFGMDDNH